MTTKLFDAGSDPDLNACVGNNTGSDDDHGYVTGFGQAALALIAAAKQQAYLDPDTNQQVDVYMDALIYPIGFCARHHIELFLKRQIARVSSLRGTPPITMDSTHELYDLLAQLEQLCVSADRRLPELLVPLKAAIAEFAGVDPTGQVFRYRKSKDDETHLADVGRINLQALGKGFAHLLAAGQEFELVADALSYEYGQGTYTDKLSREDLRSLAKALPPRDSWKESTTFDDIRKDQMKTYGLSGNDFTRAVKVIEGHHELAATIGAHRPLADVDPETLERLISMEFNEAFLLGVGDRTWKALDAIYELGHADVFSELYAHRMKTSYDPSAERMALPWDVARYLVRSPDRIRRGLTKLGQPLLISSLDRGIAQRKLLIEGEGQKELEHAAAYERQVRRMFMGDLPPTPRKYL